MLLDLDLRNKGKTLNILHFEDRKLDRHFIKILMEKRFKKAKVVSRESFLMSDTFLKTHLINEFDLIISDYCMPGMDAGCKLQELSDTGLPVIFYTCLDEKDFKDRCKQILGRIPYNFKYVQKPHINTLIDYINLEVNNEEGYY